MARLGKDKFYGRIIKRYTRSRLSLDEHSW